MATCWDCEADLIADGQEFCHRCGAGVEADLPLPHMEPLLAGAEEAEITAITSDAIETNRSDDRHHVEAVARPREYEVKVHELDNLSGYEFEDVMATVFHRLGYEVEVTPASGDEGRDLILHKGQKTVIVECKHRKGAIGRPVVQKLQGATVSYAGATHGLVVTTGRFTPAAVEYVQSSNQQTRFQVDLWDHAKLFERAAEVGIYLTTSEQATDIVLSSPRRTPEQTQQAFEARYVHGLESKPRHPTEAVDLRLEQTDYIPAILVEYAVSKSFNSSTYHLYDARERGRVLVPLNPGTVTERELSFWKRAGFTVEAPYTVEGERVETLFGVDMAPHRRRVARRVASRLSTVVSYVGRNNQRYREHCRVEPGDVQTSSKQVLLTRESLKMVVGPMEYGVRVTGDAGQEPLITHTHNLPEGGAGLRSGDGYICNDCGLIVPAAGPAAGATCVSCERTLCQHHHWEFPRKRPLSSNTHCSTCYQEQDVDREHLADPPALLEDSAMTGFAALIPGLPFFIGGRFLASVAFGALLILLAAGIGAAAAMGEVPSAVIAYLLLASLSVLTSLRWAHRVQVHKKNTAELASYSPDWMEETGPSALEPMNEEVESS